MKKFITLLAVLLSGVFVFAESVELTSAADKAEQYGATEFSVKYTGTVNNPFWDASLTASWETPSGKKLLSEGFFDGDGIYKIRFAPLEKGAYKYSFVFKAGGTENVFTGNLNVEAGKLPGFLRVSEKNSFRLMTDNGSAFYPLGIQTCGAEAMPSTVVTGRKPEQVSSEVYFKEHSGGANIYRVQLACGANDGCAIDVLAKGKKDEYNLNTLKQLDTLYPILQKNGFHPITILFQDMSRWGDGDYGFGKRRDLKGYKDIRNSEAAGYVKKYIRYIVARFSAYNDIWEFYNEDDFTPDEWLNETAAMVKLVDPCSHLMTTNYERPYLPWCDLVTPHEYMYTDELNIDLYLAKELAKYKHYKKPVFYTEFGNQAVWGNMGRNKWRVAVWSTFFNEGGLLFWDETAFRYVSGQADRPANAFLGPKERSDFKNFQAFVKEIPADARTITVYAEEESELRGYGLTAGNTAWGYVHHFASHMHQIGGLKIRIEAGFGKWEIKWIDPVTGGFIGNALVIQSEGLSTNAEVPKIKADLAFVMKKIN